jgi:carbon monoxide dehydrogenase subunit G
MATVETSISINKPPDQVFAYLTDVQNQRALNSSIIEILTDGPVAVGSHYKVKMSVMGRPFESENEIVALEPNKTFAVKTLATPPASPVTNTYTLEPEGTGTRLRLSMDADVMPGTEGMVVPQLRASLETALDGVKKALG